MILSGGSKHDSLMMFKPLLCHIDPKCSMNSKYGRFTSIYPENEPGKGTKLTQTYPQIPIYSC